MTDEQFAQFLYALATIADKLEELTEAVNGTHQHKSRLPNPFNY